MKKGGKLPAIHVLVPVQHLLSQFLMLYSSGELEVSKFIPQQLRPQKAL